MISIRTLLAVCALALPIPAAIAGCGGDDEGGDEDPQEVLDATFENDEQISSGNLDLSASVSAEGEEGGSFEFSLSGPFQGDPDDSAAIPQLDLTASASGEGGGDSIEFEGGLVVTDDNAFVEYQGETYEVGTEQFAQLKEQAEAQAGAAAEGEDAGASFEAGCAQAIEQAGGDPSACEIDFQSWLTNLSNEGTEEVGGADAIHIHGDADVEQILTDFGELAAAVPGAASQAGFDPSQLSQFSDAVTEASFDVYSDAENNLLRGLDANLTLDPSAIGGAGSVPVDSVEIAFSLEIADVNEEQTIEAPTDARPIDELLGNLGLGGLGGSGLDFDLGGGGGGAGNGGGGGGAGSADAYLECVAEADPQDPQEINECLDLL